MPEGTAVPDLVAELGLTNPVVAAPMAGGPTTPQLVLAAAGAGSLGFLAAGYQSADQLAEQIDTVRAGTSTFGVNLFAPHPVPVDPDAYARYRDLLAADAERFGVTLPRDPVEDDDAWQDKVEVLLARAVPVVSFTFGLPDPASAAALRSAGSLLVQTVTSVDEARLAAEAGLDALAVQAASAGGHSGTFTPDRPVERRPLVELVAAIRAAVQLPLIAAGGVAEARAVAAALHAGAQAVAVGTALLLAPEAGTSAAHRAGLTGRDRGDPVGIRSFSGRPAGGLANAFTAAHEGTAPLGYPAVHHLTRPIRRAAAAAGDPEYVNLWAGSGYRAIVERPAAETLRALSTSA